MADKKVMTIFGTRPEAIKMAPLVKALEKAEGMKPIVCVTAQHREMLDQVLEVFNIVPDHDLNLMKHGQTLTEITCKVLTETQRIIAQEKPDLVLVHGDTTTTFAGALAAFYEKVPVGHVEAGLRSGNMYSPFPEEINRQLASKLCSVHFAATQGNVDNLIKEGISEDLIYQTGNTVIDALISVLDKDYIFESQVLNDIDFNAYKVIPLTAHRRENQGEIMRAIFGAVRDLVESNQDLMVVFPVHMNPSIQALAKEILGEHPRIKLIQPLNYKDFCNLTARSYLIMTDSGGIQEEAPAVGKPVVVLRTETERPEAVAAGTVVMGGVERSKIYDITNKLINDEAFYRSMSEAINPYGDGSACEQIISAIKNWDFRRV